MLGNRLTSLVARSIDSLKLPTLAIIGRVESPFEIVRLRVTLSDAAVLVKSVTAQSIVPLMLVDIGKVAVIGHTTTLLGAVVPSTLQVSRKEIDADKA